MPEPVAHKPSALKPSTSCVRGRLPLVIQPPTSHTQDQSDSSSTWIEDEFEGEDEIGWGCARDTPAVVEMIKPAPTLRCEEQKDADDVDIPDSIPEAPSTSNIAPYLQVNADAELAQQLACEELFGDKPSHEEILRRQLKHMYAWQEWRMSSLRVIGETCSLMAEEEECALEWMGTRSVFNATRPEEIDRVYVEKLQGRFVRNGKSRDLNIGRLNQR
nr:glutamic acid-rich protein-like [Ipomoea batatas]